MMGAIISEQAGGIVGIRIVDFALMGWMAPVSGV
jgi:hypothetical protein